ncbi:MAG: hypothetical protein OEV66_04535 [Spirochaetia bacterium]|nr:hypothetical protein [Spirochaetia bacterium]
MNGNDNRHGRLVTRRVQKIISSFYTICFLLFCTNVISAGEALQNRAIKVASNIPGKSIKQRKLNEYLVTVKSGANEKEVRRAFAQYKIHSIAKIAERVFLIVISEDPGPEQMEKTAKTSQKIEAVQPNFLYQAL